MAEQPESERGRAAWAAVKSACGSSLPAAFVAHYEAAEPRKRQRLTHPFLEVPELEPLIRAACHDWEKLRAALDNAAPAHRGGAGFLGCRAEPYAVITSFDQLRGFASTEVTWALHEWLLDHGVGPELAKPITLGMLLYDRELASPLSALSGLALPIAVGSPLEDGVAVYVSLDEVRVGRELVVKLDGAGHAAADALRNSPLAAMLSRELSSAPPLEYPNQAGFYVLVAADPEIPFATMLDLLDVASETGHHTAALAVTSPDHGLTLLGLKTRPKPGVGYFPAMTVEITSDGTITARDPGPATTAIERDDPAALLRVAERGKKTFRWADTVIISASPEVPLQQVVDVAVAVRGPDCADELCVLPYVLLSRTPAHDHALAGVDEQGNAIVSRP